MISPGGLRWLRASECGPCACCDAARAWRLCGFGILPNKFLQRKGPCMYRAIACKSSVLYIRLPCLQALGPLQEHTTFRESLVCYTSPPGGVYVLSVLPVCSSSDLPYAVGGLALLCRGRVALLKVPGQTVQIHKPAAPSIHIPDFSGLAKPPDIRR